MRYHTIKTAFRTYLVVSERMDEFDLRATYIVSRHRYRVLAWLKCMWLNVKGDTDGNNR